MHTALAEEGSGEEQEWLSPCEVRQQNGTHGLGHDRERTEAQLQEGIPDLDFRTSFWKLPFCLSKLLQEL